jgi:hypothetical protein
LQGMVPGPAVFVVERAEPFRQQVKLLRQPKARRGSREGTLFITYLKFQIREVLFLNDEWNAVRKRDILAVPPEKVPEPKPAQPKGWVEVTLPRSAGELLWLTSGREILDNEVRWLAAETGVNEFPIYHELAEDLSPDSVKSGQPYLLLAAGAPRYQAYGGVPDWGLLDISKKGEILRLLKRPVPQPDARR